MQTTLTTGHVIGATYRSAYWGYTFRVVGGTYRPDDEAVPHGVEVEMVDIGPKLGAGSLFQVGERWTHCTHLRDDDVRIA